MASVVNHVHTRAMGYTIFKVGEQVRIKAGDFAGLDGVVASPTSAHDVVGAVNPKQHSMLLPVTVVVQTEGRKLVLRVAAEMLERR
ncbi:hypothetical protein [Lacipirellula sp.]|uniref:hypothetical protein n=1 Tax=Lacipirellula sp. TaxID=2691419 RepID=UPI003D11CA06